MDIAPYDIRLARTSDLDSLRISVKRTLQNPDGKPARKKFGDAVDRGELLVVARRGREGGEEIDAFIEWHSRVDGVVTIRDTGSAGDEPNASHVKRLVRELLRMSSPPSATVKVDADLPVWNQVFAETQGFRLEGKEYSRPKYRNIWTWTSAAEAEDRIRAGRIGRPGARR
ncbi:MAG: hypothetical protein EPO26_18535 [Chloroflexota bacterium]|nr:MAG: hypothetical protein EPO26_18535 [Chloroflexota bacterium]